MKGRGKLAVTVCNERPVAAILACGCSATVFLICLAADALAGAPGRKDVLAQLYKEAREAQQAGDYTTATRKYERIVKLQPEMAEAHANLGLLYYQQGHAEQATETFKKAIQLKPSLAGPHFFLGVLSLNARRYEEASRHLEKAEAQDPSNFAIQLYSGLSHYARSRYVEATRHLEKAAALDETDQDAFYHLSKSYGHLSKQSFDRLHKTYRDSFYTALARAHFYEAEQNWEAAREEYSRALEKRPESGRLQQRLRWVAQKASGFVAPALEGSTEDDAIDGSIRFLYAPPTGGKIQEELRRYQNLVHTLGSQKDLSAETLYGLAEGYQILSFLASLRVYETAPESHRSHQLKGQYFETLGKDEEAIQAYRRALAVKPDLQGAHFAIGNLYWTRNRLAEALAELGEELKLDPNHPQAHFEIGDILYGQGKYAPAEEHLLKAAKLDPSMIEAHLALERLYSRQEQMAKALYHLGKAVEIAPEDATPHYRLSLIYRKLGRVQEAEKERQLFEKARMQEQQR